MLPSREYLPTIPLECACFTYRQVDNPHVEHLGSSLPSCKHLQKKTNKNLLKHQPLWLEPGPPTLKVTPLEIADLMIMAYWKPWNPATLPHPRGIFKASNPIRISGYLRIVLLIRRVDIMLVSKRIPTHQVTTTIYYSWWRGRFLDFLGSLNPFMSPGDLP